MNEFNNPLARKTASTATTGKKPAVTRVRNIASGSTPGKGGTMPGYEDYRGKSAGVTVGDVADILDAIQKVTNRMADIEEGLAELKTTTSGLNAKLTTTRPFTAPPKQANLKPLEDKLDSLSDVVPTVDKLVSALKGDMGAMEGAVERHIDDVVDHAARTLHDEIVEALAGLKEDLKASIGSDSGGATVDLTGLEKRLAAAITASTASSVEMDVDRDLGKTEFYASVEEADFCQGFMLGKKFHLLSEADALLGQTAKEAGYKTVVGKFVNGEFAGLSDERHLRAYQALKKGTPAAPAPAPAKKLTSARKPATAAKPEKKVSPATGAPAADA